MPVECRPDPKKCTVCLHCDKLGQYCCASCKDRRKDDVNGLWWCKENGDTLYPRSFFESTEDFDV